MNAPYFFMIFVNPLSVIVDQSESSTTFFQAKGDVAAKLFVEYTRIITILGNTYLFC
jgi:hypothetical protein